MVEEDFRSDTQSSSTDVVRVINVIARSPAAKSTPAGTVVIRMPWLGQHRLNPQ